MNKVSDERLAELRQVYSEASDVGRLLAELARFREWQGTSDDKENQEEKK